jgi:hypothetical protein
MLLVMLRKQALGLFLLHHQMFQKNLRSLMLYQVQMYLNYHWYLMYLLFH